MISGRVYMLRDVAVWYSTAPIYYGLRGRLNCRRLLEANWQLDITGQVRRKVAHRRSPGQSYEFTIHLVFSTHRRLR